MLSTGQPSSSSSNFQIIVDALDDYAKQTGIDLTKNPFVEKIQHSNSPDDILGLLKEREKTFKNYRDVNRRLINCLTPAVKVLHAFSGILGKGASLVSRKRHMPSCEYFNVTSSGPVPTSKGCVHRD
jgi:fungal STAND N-terminal Goodbye domain